MASKNNKVRNGGQEITLMTVLANEATGPSRKILKEYGVTDVKDYKDLEVKLAELYFKTPDKVELEKKLAFIHPHRKWILKNTEPVVVETKQEVVEEVKSNLDSTACSCPNCQQMYQNKDFLNFNSDNQNTQNTQKLELSSIIAPTLLFAVIGLTYVMVIRSLNQK
jgi:hypothetical protein